jgi:hypothetical protein
MIFYDGSTENSLMVDKLLLHSLMLLSSILGPETVILKKISRCFLSFLKMLRNCITTDFGIAGVLDFIHRPDFNSYKKKEEQTRRFGNWICSRPQVRGDPSDPPIRHFITDGVETATSDKLRSKQQEIPSSAAERLCTRDELAQEVTFQA